MSKKGKAKGGKDEARKSTATAKPNAENGARRQASASGELGFTLVSKALADPTRMSILRRIAAGHGSCSDVKERLGISAATLSHHLKELERAGIVSLYREGRFVNAALDKKAWKQYVSELKTLVA